MTILVANIGSTSFKYRLYDMEGTKVLARGLVERIGQPGGACPDCQTALTTCLAEIAGPGKPLSRLTSLSGIAFKTVHAGPLSGARLVDDAVLAAMEEFSFLAPAHNRPYLAAIRAFRKRLPELPLVAVFETAFFDSLDEATVTYAVPYSWRQDHGIRRYGFHGASHQAASECAQQHLGRTDLRHISCHLGGSASLAAIRNGVAIDTSFGMSPQSGLPQSNRTGDFDVFAALHLIRQRSLSVEEMGRVLACESGLAGISGGSGDIRDLTAAAAAGDARARLALDVFIRSVRHYLGAFLVELGGVDVITFSGGIGENSPEIRAAVCAGLAPLGLQLDGSRNRTAAGEVRISSDASPAAILVAPADEERIVARAAAAALAAAGRG
ncbi:MAG: acetate/propionate family kinase [Acidobacteriia bacterium]|nr:acetate/propionate family kinase [Terriglobia bacterium]